MRSCPNFPSRLLPLCLLVAVATAAPAATNLVVNGDFEAGNSGFWSDYPYFTGPGSILPFCYMLVENPSDWHVVGQDYGDHTSGSGLMMMANGATIPDQTVWGQTFAVTPNTDHDISIWVSNWSTGLPARLRLLINDVPLGTFSSVGLGSWSEFTTSWNSGAATTAAVRIVDLDTASAGNDFSLDDISITALKLTIPFDIKPTSCPNAFNDDQMGVNPTAILGTAEFDVASIDLASVQLRLPNGTIAPARSSIEDVATPLPAAPDLCACTTAGPDGLLDQTLKFDSQEVTAALGDHLASDEIELCIQGQLIDGSPFEGCDCIVITGPVSTEIESWGTLKASYR